MCLWKLYTYNIDQWQKNDSIKIANNIIIVFELDNKCIDIKTKH